MVTHFYGFMRTSGTLPTGSYNLQVSSGGRRLSAPVLIKSCFTRKHETKTLNARSIC